MNSTTAIPAVKAAILKTLEGAEGLAGVVITDDVKAADRALEHIFMWKAKATRDFAGMARKPPPLDEEIKVTLLVVAIGNGTRLDVETRAYAIAAAAESALRGDIKLEGVALSCLVAEIDEDPLDFDTKRGTRLILTVKAKARIQ